MKLNSAIKVLLIAIPTLFLVACSGRDKDNNVTHESITAGTGGGGTGGEFGGYSASDLQDRYNTLYFNFDSDEITNESKNILNAHTLYLNKVAGNIQIEGHADERGSAAYNIALGQNRANAVKNYLKGQGIDANRMSTISYGKEKPAVLGHDEESYSKNRRGVINYN